MKEIKAEGKTVREAIAVALKKLGAKKDEVEIKILNEEDKGLFGMQGTKHAKIRAILKKGKK